MKLLLSPFMAQLEPALIGAYVLQWSFKGHLCTTQDKHTDTVGAAQS